MSFDFREWYAQARALLFQLRNAQHWRLTCEPRTILEGDATPENLAKAQRFAISLARARAKGVQSHLGLFRSFEADLDEGFNTLWRMLMPAYVEFRDLEVENLPPSRCAWGVMKSLIEFLDWYWAGPLLRLVESEIPYLSAKDSIRWFNEEHWLLRIIDPIHARLTLEESWLLKYAPPPLVSSEPIAETTTKNKSKTRNKLKAPRRKRYLTDNQEKLAAAIRSWHGFELETLSCSNCIPISNEELAHKADVTKGKATTQFFARWFPKGGNAEYRKLCRLDDPRALAVAIAKLSREGALAVVSLAGEYIADRNGKPPGDDIDE